MTMPNIAELESIVRRHTEEVRVHLLAVVVAALTPGQGNQLAGGSTSSVGGTLNKSARAVKKGAKRSPEALEILTRKLLGYITKNPGERIEQIGVGLGLPTKELVLPAKKLIGDGSVRTKGAKRATAYFSK